jgi:hypothetical protein
MFPIPTIAQPQINKSPPTGVIGPTNFLGPISKHSRYILPENMAVPNAVTLAPDHDDGEGGVDKFFLSIVDRESNATAWSS